MIHLSMKLWPQNAPQCDVYKKEAVLIPLWPTTSVDRLQVLRTVGLRSFREIICRNEKNISLLEE
jgi:hypothetical protein